MRKQNEDRKMDMIERERRREMERDRIFFQQDLDIPDA